MKKNILKFLSLAFLLLLPFSVNAEGTYVKENGTGDVVEHSLFTAGNIVNATDNVHGLDFVAGNSVKVTGESEYGFYAGNDVTVSNQVEKDLFVGGNTIIIDSSSKIGRDLYAAGNNVTINTNVNGNAFIGGSIITLKDANITGDLRLGCEKLIIEGNVNITGTLYIDSDSTIDNESGLTVGKKEVYEVEKELDTKSFSNIIVETLTSIASIMVVGFILNSLFSKMYENATSDLETKKELKNILFGLLWLIVVPLFSIILMCTIIGVRFGFALLLLYVISLILAIVFASVVCGNIILTKLFKVKDNSYLAIAIGVLALKIISLIPYIGGTVYFLALLYGIGKSVELFNKARK